MRDTSRADLCCQAFISGAPALPGGSGDHELTRSPSPATNNFMQKVLCVLSDLSTAPFSPHIAMDSLLVLKQRGARRIDVTTDPRHHIPEQHGAYARPVTDFDKTARRFCRDVVLPVIGQSELIDITRALSPSDGPPDLSSLSHVGRLFVQTRDSRVPKDMAVHDGGTLGLAFYLATHRPSAHHTYDTLLCPDLTHAGRAVLSSFPNVIGPEIEPYGWIVHLSVLRDTLRKMNNDRLVTPRNEANAAPRRYLAS
jgi:hypothetical protein